MTSDSTGATIDEQFRARFPRSAALYARAKASIAGGVTLDARNLLPFPIYVDRAEGARKWDVDGNELIDCWLGNDHCSWATAIQRCRPR